MAWQEWHVRTEELTERTYRVRAQSYRHALNLVRTKLEEEGSVDNHECVFIHGTGEEVKL